jgi:hypothetical protein
MKTHAALLIVLCLAMPVAVYAWAGPLTSPSISPGKGATGESTGAVLELLRTKCGFVKGDFLNEFQTMDFSGSADVIPELLRLLKAARIDAAVAAAHLADTNVTFRIQQYGWSSDMHTRVVVNLDYPHRDRAGLGKLLGVDLGATPAGVPAPSNRQERTPEQRLDGGGAPARQR